MSAWASACRSRPEGRQRQRDLAQEAAPIGTDEGGPRAAVKEWVRPRQPGQRSRPGSLGPPSDRERERVEQALARFRRQGCLVEQFDEQREIARGPVALGDAEPAAPAESALVAHRLALDGEDEKRHRLLDLALRGELCPHDVSTRRRAGEPACHRQPKRIVEECPRDAGVVEALRRRPERLHPRGEARQALARAPEHVRVVGVRHEKAQRLVELAQDPRRGDAHLREPDEQAALLGPVGRAEARRRRRERRDERSRGHWNARG